MTFWLKVSKILSLNLSFRLKVDDILSLNMNFRLSEELIQGTLKNVEVNYSNHPAQTVTLKRLCVDVDTMIFTLHAGVSRTNKLF